MGMGKGIAIAGLVVVALCIVAFVIVPSVDMPNSMNLRWSVYGMKDGQRVTRPMAFIDPEGVVIDALGADASWAAQGENIDWSTLNIEGEFLIYLLSYMGALTDITPTDLSILKTGAAAQEGTAHFELPLDILVLGRPYTASNTNGYYWDVRIVLTLHGIVWETVGSGYVEDTLEDHIDYRVYWQDGTFSLTGGLV